MAYSSPSDDPPDLTIIKRARRGPHWVLRFFESDIVELWEVKIYQDLAEWLDDNAPGWSWKTVMSREGLGWLKKYDWYRPEVIDGQYADILFPDQGSMTAFMLRWCK